MEGLEFDDSAFKNYSTIKENGTIQLLNALFDFRTKFMPDDSLIDVIKEFADKNNYNPIEVAQELAEYDGFQQIMEQDCIKFNFALIDHGESIEGWD